MSARAESFRSSRVKVVKDWIATGPFPLVSPMVETSAQSSPLLPAIRSLLNVCEESPAVITRFTVC